MARVLCVASLVVIIAGRLLAHFPDDWWLENIAVAVAILTLLATRTLYPLSTTSYVLVFAFLCVHEYGAIYSYNFTPIGEWMKPWFHAERNHYDRLVHFASGVLLVLPCYEVFTHVVGRRGAWPLFLAIQAVLFLGALYEIAEWAVASVVDPQLGAEFTGAQGDIWDATKDLTCALGGALLAAGAVPLFRARKL